MIAEARQLAQQIVSLLTELLGELRNLRAELAELAEHRRERVG